MLAMNLAVGIARSGCGTVLYISLEMPGVDLARRALGASSRLSATIIENGIYTDHQIERIMTGSRSLAGFGDKLVLYDRPGLNLLSFSALVRQMADKYDDLCCVFVDYIQLMRTPETYSREREVATISAMMVEVARQHNIVVFPLSQLNDGGRTRESKAVEHDAQTIITIDYPPEGHELSWTPGSSDVACKIVVKKNRHGQTGALPSTFRRAHHCFDIGGG